VRNVNSADLRERLQPTLYRRVGWRSIVPGAVTATDESARTVAPRVIEASGSERVAEARARADQRLRRQRGALRPLGWAVIAAVVVGGAGGHPAPALQGKGLAVTVALCVFGSTLAFAIRARFTHLGLAAQATVISAMGAAAVALVALQPRAATGLAGGAAVWMAVARLPYKLGIALGAGVTVALAVAAGLSGTSSAGVLATTLLCALLGLIAHFMKQARESQERTEVLLAQLEDARDEQARAAAVAERGRIASELHDVLAHSLSGAAIQLQGARMLAERADTEPRMRAAIDRSIDLVREGLASAREAVGALRGDDLRGVPQLQALIAGCKDDLCVDATLKIEGCARRLTPEASLALYRGAQEALTNVARYAPGAITTVVLRYDAQRTTLSVENEAANAAPGAARSGLVDVGGGRGLTGMRERIERAGGTLRAGATDGGWRVELEVPT
jgi:signal transduction histidine kinase